MSWRADSRTQILEHAALHDAEQQVSRRPLGIGVTAAFGPAGGHGQRSGGVGVIRPGGHALVKHHHNVRIQVALDAHHLFRRDRCFEPSRWERKVTPSSLMVRRWKAEDLKAAAVREDGLVPRVEAVQAAAPRHEFVAGPQVQVIVLPRMISAPMALRSSGAMASRCQPCRRA